MSFQSRVLLLAKKHKSCKINIDLHSTIKLPVVSLLQPIRGRRHSNGKVQEVHGEGVVGEQPYLRPGEGFQYSSGTMIETPVGTMHGSYQLVADDGVAFDAEIRPFRLSIPRVLH